ncbi:hypothetical protein NEDG_02075 [Nematocida displodere]|uniref:RING-type domain-containing protein n=1 Tax=Nematocida displodere TaxID=1805483 RepID=A0A177EKD0_9MICR|nr:hypothetical protein NEDG_02075 [Nematocida displodere]
MQTAKQIAVSLRRKQAALGALLGLVVFLLAGSLNGAEEEDHWVIENNDQPLQPLQVGPNFTYLELHDAEPTLEKLHSLIGFLSKSNPELEQHLGCQDVQQLIDTIEAVECLNIDLSKYSVEELDLDMGSLNLVCMPLQKVHIYNSDEAVSDPVNTEKKFICLILDMANIGIQTLKISNLDKHAIRFDYSLPWRSVPVKDLVFENVSEYVIAFVTTIFNFSVERSLSLTILRSNITSLMCLDNMSVSSSSNEQTIFSLTLENLPRFTDFQSKFFQLPRTVECIDSLILRNLGTGHFDLEENNMYSLFYFIGLTGLNRLILPMSIFSIIWNDMKYNLFYNMKAVSLYIEDIEDPVIDTSPQLYYTHKHFYNPNTTNLALSFNSTANLTATGVNQLLEWVGLGFIHVENIAIYPNTATSLLPNIQAAKDWTFVAQRLKSLRVEGKEAKLTYTWKEDMWVAELPELTQQPYNERMIYLIPYTSYKDWASEKIYGSLTPAAARILPKNKYDQAASFRCPVCLVEEDDWENKAPVVALFECGHCVCAECLDGLFGVGAPEHNTSPYYVKCPLCRVDVSPKSVALLTKKADKKMRLVKMTAASYNLRKYYTKQCLSMEFEGIARPSLKRKRESSATRSGESGGNPETLPGTSSTG